MTETALSVRTSRPEDGPVLRGLDSATWSALVSPAPAPDDDDPFFSERLLPDDVLVADLGCDVVGYVSLSRVFPIPSSAHVLQVSGLAVSPSAQDRGVGRALVEAAVEEARRRGATKLSLRVLGGNGAARRLYERCGFVVEGVLVGEFVLDGAEVDDVLMARRLV